MPDDPENTNPPEPSPAPAAAAADPPVRASADPPPAPEKHEIECPACGSHVEGKTITKRGQAIEDLEKTNKELREENETLKRKQAEPAPAPAAAAKTSRGYLRKRRKAA